MTEFIFGWTLLLRFGNVPIIFWASSSHHTVTFSEVWSALQKKQKHYGMFVALVFVSLSFEKHDSSVQSRDTHNATLSQKRKTERMREKQKPPEEKKYLKKMIRREKPRHSHLTDPSITRLYKTRKNQETRTRNTWKKVTNREMRKYRPTVFIQVRWGR